MNYGKIFKDAVMIGLLVAILVLLVRGQATMSMYVPSELTTKPGSAASRGPQSFSDLQSSIECVPGPSPDAEYYTSGLTPGGLCGGGDFVHSQMRDFSIVDGIGGSLLEK